MQQHNEMNREQWLSLVMDELRPHFRDALKVVGAKYPQTPTQLPKNIRVTCGFPSQHARSAKYKAIGESWTSAVSADKTFEVLVSPIEDRSVEAAAILCHELGHIADDHKHGHRGPFRMLVKEMGLDGPATATYAGDKFKQIMRPIIKLHGHYPHAKLDVLPEYKKQSTRLLKCMCPVKGCGYTVRVTRTWIDKAGAPICPNNDAHRAANAKGIQYMVEMMSGKRKKAKLTGHAS